MMLQIRRSRKGQEAMMMVSATDYDCRGLLPTGRSERRTGRWAVVGVLALTLGTSALGLVCASRTQLASAVRANMAPATPSSAPHSPAPRPEAAGRLTMQVLRPSLAVTKKREQTASRVGDNVYGQETTLSFTPLGLTFNFSGSRPPRGVIRKIARDHDSMPQGGVAALSRRVITLAFVDANPDVVPQGHEPVPETISPSTDPQLPEKNDRPTAPTLRYRDVWPGIDLLYTVTGNRLRSTFVVKPGADPNQIQFAYHGVVAVKHTEAGELEIFTPVRSFVEEMPVAYQESLHLARLASLRDGVSGKKPGVFQDRDSRRVGVAVAYTLQPSGETSVWGIHVGAYDPNTPLIIERIVRFFGGIGGSDSDMNPDPIADHDREVHANAFSRLPQTTSP